MVRRRWLAWVALVVVGAAESRADPGRLAEAEWEPDASGVPPASEDPPGRRDPTLLDPARRALHVAAALGPGAIVHGSGHVAAGRPDTAARLALTQAAGLGLMAGGIAGLALTGASRYVAAPLALGIIAGGGLFFLPWAADIYGTVTYPDGAGQAPRRAPRLVSELGHRYVHDPQFRYRHFLAQGTEARFGAARLAYGGWFALDDRNARVRLAAGYRLSEPTRALPARDGGFVELELALTHHRFDSDGFRAGTVEASLGARHDLARWDPALAGAFVEGAFGLAVQRFDYRVSGMAVPADTHDLLLARYAFGFYLGRGERSGEARLFYDHRHDDYAAGLQVPGLGSGVAGHLGVDARWFWGSLGVRAEAQVGSAWLGRLSLLFRAGDFP